MNMKPNLTKFECNAIDVALDNLIEQLTDPYSKDNREKLQWSLSAQSAMETAVEDSLEDYADGRVDIGYAIARCSEIMSVNIQPNSTFDSIMMRKMLCEFIDELTKAKGE